MCWVAWEGASAAALWASWAPACPSRPSTLVPAGLCEATLRGDSQSQPVSGVGVSGVGESIGGSSPSRPSSQAVRHGRLLVTCPTANRLLPSLPQETKGSVAVRVALGETQLVQEVRRFLLDNGVSLDSFSQVGAHRLGTAAAHGELGAGLGSGWRHGNGFEDPACRE